MNVEQAETYCLAALGLVSGFSEYYVRPEITAKRTWLAIGLVVAAHELLCPPGQLLSEGVDRALERHPVAVTALIGITALHLLNKLPPTLDPYHQITISSGRQNA